ncbi:MAG TPA: hypothetical protein DCE41_37355 [Cytophagales bacterium]|nr:hypothetical protein [Cytophagales bacterium]
MYGGAANDFGFVRTTGHTLRWDSTGAAYEFNGDSSVRSTKEATLRIMGGNGQEAIRLQTNGDSFLKAGKLGIGTDRPDKPLHVHTAVNDQAAVRFSSGAAWIEGRLPNADQAEWNTSAAHILFNRPIRTTEVESPVGNNLRMAAGTTTLTLQTNAHLAGLNTTPEAALSIGGGGKVSTPNASMHLTPDVILFGGRNSGMEVNSAQISAGLHEANSLNFIGMGSTWQARKITMWAEGGFKLHGYVANPTDMNGGLRIGDNTFNDYKLYSLKFGQDDTNQLGLGTFPAARGPAEMKRNGMAFHAKNTMGFAWFTSGWTPLASLDAATKRAHYHGDITTAGKIGVGHGNPQAQLSLGADGVGNHRDWMNTGTFMSETSDYMYVGLKKSANNRADAVIAWGDDDNDLLRFYYGKHGQNEREVARLTPDGRFMLRALDTVHHTVHPPNAFVTSHANRWADFPSLTKTFSLSTTTSILAYYSISGPGSNSHLVTRLLVDGTVVAKTISGNVAYWANRDMYLAELGSGSHTIKVQYRSPATAAFTINHDWQDARLQVLVMGGTL